MSRMKWLFSHQMIAASIVLLFAVATAALGRRGAIDITFSAQQCDGDSTGRSGKWNHRQEGSSELPSEQHEGLAFLRFWIQADAVVEGGVVET